jgi:hypothetical protein
LASGVIDISAGTYHTCAVLSSGVKCWGKDANGQLGNGKNTDSNVPVDVTGLSSGVTQLGSGERHSCAVTPEGVVKCWGGNFYGQLGNGSRSDSNVPVDVSGELVGVTTLAVGYQYTCAGATGSDALRCWGNNDDGQFGDGTTESSTMPKDSKWLTADGLVEDNKTQVIIPPIAHTAVVIPAQPVETPTVVTVTVDPTPPDPPAGTQIPAGTVIDLDEKLPVDCSMWWYWSNAYNASPQNALDFNANTLNVYKYVDGAWTPLLPCTGCSVDTTAGVIKAVLPGPGKYAVMYSTDSYIYLPLAIH